MLCCPCIGPWHTVLLLHLTLQHIMSLCTSCCVSHLCCYHATACWATCHIPCLSLSHRGTWVLSMAGHGRTGWGRARQDEMWYSVEEGCIHMVRGLCLHGWGWCWVLPSDMTK